MKELREFTIKIQVVSAVSDGERVQQFIVSNVFGERMQALIRSKTSSSVEVAYRVSCDSLMKFSGNVS